jgi:predicted ABC-type ATPase
MQRQRRRPKQKRIVIIAGPNGAGKTTFANEFLLNEADCPDFINADLIARGLSPFAPETEAFQAGRIMLNQIAAKVKAGASFAFETTLSGKSYARHIREWRDRGYHVKLVFLSLPSVELAVSRVKSRVVQGGHSVPEAVIRRRFVAGLRNFQTVYRPIVSSWIVYNNAGPTPVILAVGENP